MEFGKFTMKQVARIKKGSKVKKFRNEKADVSGKKGRKGSKRDFCCFAK